MMKGANSASVVEGAERDETVKKIFIVEDVEIEAFLDCP